MSWDYWTGTRVRVYRNLQNGLMSIQAQADGKWSVVGHVSHCAIANVTMKVSEAGQQRAIAQGQRNVHAWAEGDLIGQFPDWECTIPLFYHYLQTPTFVVKETGVAIASCPFLTVDGNRVLIRAG
jgi:hypothetical protein